MSGESSGVYLGHVWANAPSSEAYLGHIWDIIIWGMSGISSAVLCVSMMPFFMNTRGIPYIVVALVKKYKCERNLPLKGLGFSLMCPYSYITNIVRGRDYS